MATVLKRGRVSLDMVDLTGEPRLVKPKRRRQLTSAPMDDVELGTAFTKITALAAPVAIPKQQGLTRQQALGRLGGKCAGSIGANKFAVEVAADGRSRCQLRSCKQPLKIGELRLGKRPPSLRHGQNKKCTWYHPECAMVAFAACSKKSRVVETVQDIDYGFDGLSAKDQARIRKAVENAPKGESVRVVKPRKCQVGATSDLSRTATLDERDLSKGLKGRVSRDLSEDEAEKPSGSISTLRAAGSFVQSPKGMPPKPLNVAEEMASFAFGASEGLSFDEAMTGDFRDEPFYRDALYTAPSRLEEALSQPLPDSPLHESLLRPHLESTYLHWDVPLDQLVDVAITGPLALVACDDDVETVVDPLEEWKY